jgi:hypothetical protein
MVLEQIPTKLHVSDIGTELLHQKIFSGLGEVPWTTGGYDDTCIEHAWSNAQAGHQLLKVHEQRDSERALNPR